MCLSIQNWFEQPITWQEEKRAVLAVTAIVVAVLALGAICYTYQGGRFADIPGYNQNYAYGCWALAGTISLGTVISYIVKSILSDRRIDRFYNKPLRPRVEALYQLPFKDACEKNGDFKQLTSGIPKESIVLLSEQEFLQSPFIGLIEYSSHQRGYYSHHGIHPNSLLAVFEAKNSSFLAGRQSTGAWFVVARIVWMKPSGEKLDGVCLLTQGDAVDARWYGSIKFFNYKKDDWLADDIGKKRFTIGFISDQYFLNVPPETKWIQKIVEGKAPGMIIPPSTEEKPLEQGTLQLWKPALKTLD